jgi:hypothetical protein
MAVLIPIADLEKVTHEKVTHEIAVINNGVVFSYTHSSSRDTYRDTYRHSRDRTLLVDVCVERFYCYLYTFISELRKETTHTVGI